MNKRKMEFNVNLINRMYRFTYVEIVIIRTVFMSHFCLSLYDDKDNHTCSVVSSGLPKKKLKAMEFSLRVQIQGTKMSTSENHYLIASADHVGTTNSRITSQNI